MTANDWTVQVKRGILEYCVLTIVNKEPSYGYDLVTTLGEWNSLATKEGTLYPLLRRLQKDGLIDSFWRESESGPPRKYYRLTAKGREHLSLMDDEWGKLTSAIQELKSHKGDDSNGEKGKTILI